jgi:hypothetical protein
MNGDSRDMPGHRPAVAPTTTDHESVARDQVAAAIEGRWVGARGFLREVESGQGVKDGGERCSPASDLDPRAAGRATHHGTPGEQLASQPGASPRTPEHHRQAILKALGGDADQPRQQTMSDSSRETQAPIELSDMCPRAVLRLFRRPDGRLVVRRMPCKTRSCPWCGPRIRAKQAAQWAHAMAGDRVYRLVVTNDAPAKLRRRKAYRGQELGHIPAPDGQRVVYTTVAVGELVTDRVGTLARDFAAQPDDGRRARLTDGWRQVLEDLEAEAVAKREPWECLEASGGPLSMSSWLPARLVCSCPGPGTW